MEFALEAPRPKRRPEDVRLADIRRRFAAAKKRALYWSGIPFAPAPVSLLKKGTHRGAHDGYHAAVAEARDCAALIYRLTGRRPKPFDPRVQIKEPGQAFLSLKE